MRRYIDGCIEYAAPTYVVYRRILWFFKLYLRIQPYHDWQGWMEHERILFEYGEAKRATEFHSEKEARELIDAIHAHPEKFVSYTY